MPAKLSTRPTLRSCAIGGVGLALLGAGLPATSADGSEADLSRFYRQKVTWTKCDGVEMPEGPPVRQGHRAPRLREARGRAPSIWPSPATGRRASRAVRCC